MCRLQCFFAFAALTITLVNSWDIAITTGGQLEFYTNRNKTGNEGTRFRDLTALAYDAVHNMLLFVDKQNDNASIFSFHLATKKYQSLVRRRSDENIQGIAFDPVESLLFWTDFNERSIFWISLKPGSKNDIYGNLLIKMDDEIPRAIAVDSCRGYIYWTNIKVNKPTIERAKFDGSDRKVIIDTNIYMPVSLAIDQATKRLIWADDKEGIHYAIESSDLEGNNREVLQVGVNHQPNSLSVSKDSIYWVDWGFRSVWQLPKNNKKKEEPIEVVSFTNEVPFGIVANYQLPDQIKDVAECEVLASFSQNKSAINDSFNIPRDVGLFCLHGVKVPGKSACSCSTGYTGERCEISVCQNYCLHGDCSLTGDGKPKCICTDGFTGPRCEVDLCEGHCMNKGICSLDGQKPTCQCKEDFEGPRCETAKAVPTTTPEPSNDVRVVTADVCNCTKVNNTKSSASFALESLSEQDAYAVACNDGWDPVRDPIIMVLGITTGLLCAACAVLITKILQLKKRPRIKKRIIVNKNVTPMTARPDQCEITIENCCNMNICETPCFEPRSTIRPTLLDAKPGKEEKRNLIANMEYPDDY